MGLFRGGEILGIADETLDFVLRASEQAHPNEYMGFLRADDADRLGLDRNGQVITDVLVIPGTETNPTSAKVKTLMQPNNVQSVGSVHSHPNGVLRPSNADLGTFGRGSVHIIVGAPYRRTDWQAFDSTGEPITLDVLDVELPEEEFFELTQADIDRELLAEDRRTRSESGDREDDDGGFLSWLGL